jgi:hypothetical protein
MQITKEEWTKIVGINLALLLGVYFLTVILTLCGNNFFALQFENPQLDKIEETLRGWKISPIVQSVFSVVFISFNIFILCKEFVVSYLMCRI